MTCDLNRNTIKNGIEKIVSDQLSKTGLFIREGDLYVPIRGFDVLATINEINNIFKENIVLPVEGGYMIGDSSDRLIDRYLTPNIEFALKSINILQSEKAIAIFDKREKNKWSLDKVLTELQIPALQKSFILDSGLKTREDILTNLLADYSYAIEINITKENISYYDTYNELEEWEKTTPEERLNYNGPGMHFEKPTFPWHAIDRYGKTLAEFNTKEEAEVFVTELKKNEPYKNTEFYKNMTVPGGTNYRENEITTPAITPVIKGHGSFSTDNGIGWFRSDDKGRSVPTGPKQEDGAGGLVQPTLNIKDGTNTRRILEIQSDLFQKGRDIKSPDEIIEQLKKEGKLKIEC